MTVDEILHEVHKYEGLKYVCLTGGEPLIQSDVLTLIYSLREEYILDIETNGCVILPDVQSNRCHFVMDIKLPSSGEFGTAVRLYEENARKLNWQDAVKFVVGSREDFVTMVKMIENIKSDVPIYISPVWGQINLELLVVWMKEFKLYDARMQLQMHKIIWDPMERGV